jgi:hypothetical protein
MLLLLLLFATFAVAQPRFFAAFDSDRAASASPAAAAAARHFTSLDVDGSGSLSPQEISLLPSVLPFPGEMEAGGALAGAVLEQVLRQLDRDRSGEASVPELEHWLGSGGAEELAALIKQTRCANSLPKGS